MGENINCLASPFWRLNAENIENASKQIENLVNNNPGITIIYQLYDSCIFFVKGTANWQYTTNYCCMENVVFAL